MTNKIEQYHPAFFEGFENIKEPFTTLEDLKAIPFVARFAKEPGFCGYAINDNLLMATYRGGSEWLVVGMIGHPEDVDLPVWKPVTCWGCTDGYMVVGCPAHDARYITK